MAHYLSPRLTARAALVVLSAVLLLNACSKPASEGVAPVPLPPRDVGTIVTKLRMLTSEANRESVADADMLVDAVGAFLKTPNETTRTALQHSWLKAHDAFAATRALLIGDHDDLLFKIDAWPIQPGFLDSLPQYPDSGIINDFTLKITRETLAQQNGITDNEEVCLGFHPLEYYAFARPVSDFVAKDDKSLLAKTIDRRRRALSLIAEMLDTAIKQLSGAMNDDLAAFVPRSDKDTASDDRLVSQIIAGSRRMSHHQFQEASLIVDKDEGHGQFSQSSLATLEREVVTEREIYASTGDLMKILRSLDEKTASNLDTTLSKITATLGSDKLSPADKVKLPLMFSAIGHQFDDLARHLPKQSP